MDGQDPIGSLINGSPIPPQKVSQLSSPLASQLSMSIVHHSMYITYVHRCKILSKNATLRHIDNAQIWVYTLDIQRFQKVFLIKENWRFLTKTMPPRDYLF